MDLLINRDFFDAPKPPAVYLCNTSKRIIGELQAYDRHGNFKWNSYSEIQFSVEHTYVDLLDGETKVHPLYDKVEVPRNILLQHYGYFCLQDIDDTSGDNDTKTVSAFSLEYATSNKYLTSFHINTGEVDSVEVLYNEKIYGTDYNTDRDSFYKLASGEFDPYENYYQKVYTDNTSYIWEQVQVNNAEMYSDYINKNNSSDAQDHEKLYMKNFPNVQFYNPNRQELSLLHLIFEYIPEWQIGNVDQNLWHKERKFSEERISVYDFLNNNVAETFGCTFVWDSLGGVVHCYEEVEDDSDIENEASTRWETDVFISKDNLASQVDVKYSSDNIKTKLVVTGSDNLDIREVNLGRNEIMDLSFYHTKDWMEDDLFYAYEDYLEAMQEAETGLDKYGDPSEIYPMAYSDVMQKWVAANNHYTDLMNEVPAEGNVVLVGDEFKRLYCTYTPINTAYANMIITDSIKWVDELYSDAKFTTKITEVADGDEYYAQGYKLVYVAGDGRFQVMENLIMTSKTALVKKLNLYHVDEDTEANKADNILLKMKNSTSDVATVRIYDNRIVASEYNPDVKYYTKDDNEKYAEILITDAVDFDAQVKTFGSLYTNDYRIQSIVVRASHGTPEAADEYSMTDWVKGDLTAKKMDLEGYSITYIGTMGAYFVLAKDETQTENLQDYGIRMLEEKHKIYTSIFQTQTEAMFSYEKHQCIVQDEQPEGDYKDGTRWLDTNSNPVQLYEYKLAKAPQEQSEWVKLTTNEEGVSSGDKENYENYQRYTDNYMKLQAVQSVLSEKEREAEYYSNGYSVDTTIDFSRYTKNGDGNYVYDGQLLTARLESAAAAHFPKKTIASVSVNQDLPLYIFTTSADPIEYGKNDQPFHIAENYYIKTPTGAYAPVIITDSETFKKYNGETEETTLYVLVKGHRYAVYLDGTTPYVSFADSKGVYQMVMEYIREKTEMSTFFTKDQWIRLSPFIKEDEFNDNNFLLTGYESEEERISICEELMESAVKELKILCKPSLEFSMTMANILALPEFKPLFNQFQLGNFIRVGLRDGYIKRSRLLEVDINFDDLSDFSCTFGNLVTTKSEIDRHADLLAQAVSAGKQVAKSSGAWQRSADKTNKLEEEIEEGLQQAALSVAASSGQSITWDERGILGRKVVDGTTDVYAPEQFMLTNNKLVFTNSNWESSKGVFGEYKVGEETRWGILADAVVAGYIESPTIVGGTLSIGDGLGSLFQVDEHGNVTIQSGGTEKYASKGDVDTIATAYRFRVVLDYENPTIFTDTDQDCEITCEVYEYANNITGKILALDDTKFVWTRKSNNKTSDVEWNKEHANHNSNIIIITKKDVDKNSQFYCTVEFDETQFSAQNT